MTAGDVVLVAQAIASAAMCGILWFVQIVHYPGFDLVSGDGRSFAGVNRRRTARVVVPAMLIEALTAAAVLWRTPAGVPFQVAVVNAGLFVAACLSTAAVQMPLHARLGRDGIDPATVAMLVRTNWLRTAAWTARAAIAVWMLRVAA